MKQLFLLITTAILLNSFSLYSQSDMSAAIEKRLEISGRLDSLELEKQKMKRTGESIKVLDELSAALRDSIEMLRENMPIISESDIETEGDVLPRGFSFFKPKSLFDWLIIGAGGAALLSGIILIFGIFSSLKKNNKQPIPNTTLSQKLAHNKNGLLDIPITKDKPVNLPKEIPKQDVEGINRLREKIQSDKPIASVSPFDRNREISPAMPPSANTSHVNPSKTALSNTGRDIKSEILQAARNGMSETEIARQFKVSVDQVSLVLKMSDGSMRGV